uniref:Cubilin-like protein n=1 Tax=Halisarca dujardinii TaxID=2583056 RepID=A0AA96S0X8_HALDU|nr:cubilin-like protein [Halisarca dujardinii]
MTQLFFVAIAICATAVSAVPSLGTPPPTPTEPSKVAGHSINLEREKHGYFTSEWTPNTMKCFGRVEAVVEVCPITRKEYFIRYVDEGPSAGEQSLGSVYLSKRRNSWCILEKQYVRDNRNATSMPLARENVIYIKSSANDSGKTYALSKEVVWQLEIPPNYGAYLIMNPFSLQAPSRTKHQCIDYVAVHFHENEYSVPKLLCGMRHEVLLVNVNASKLTIKFVSDESVNQGGFHGGLLIYPAADLIKLSGYGMNVMSMMARRARRHPNGGSGMGPISVTRPSLPVPSDDCNAGDSDCEKVQPQPQPAHDPKPEPKPEPEPEPEPEPKPIANELDPKAMWCFSDIVQNGFEAALKHLGDSSSLQCQMFAQIFLQDDYVAPT